MKILLDENITPKSIPVLEEYGHDAIYALDRLRAGESDEEVFQLALKEQRALITLNGKDFIVFIPPRTDLELRYGLIWLRGFQVTRKTYDIVMNTIGEFLQGRKWIKNTYYAVKQSGNSYEIIRRYPQRRTESSERTL